MSTPLVVKRPDSNHTGHIAPGALVAIERLGPAELAVYEANASQSTRLESGLGSSSLVESSRSDSLRAQVRRSVALPCRWGAPPPGQPPRDRERRGVVAPESGPPKWSVEPSVSDPKRACWGSCPGYGAMVLWPQLAGGCCWSPTSGQATTFQCDQATRGTPGEKESSRLMEKEGN